MAAIGVFVSLGVAMAASASGASLANGGFGQRSTDPSSFGFAVCNKDTAAFSGSVPVSVVANGVTQNISVAESLTAGACAYSYLPYATFNMTAGNTYSITVTVNGQDQATYASILVPSAGKVLGASTMSAAQRAYLLNELANAEALLKVLLAKLNALLK